MVKNLPLSFKAVKINGLMNIWGLKQLTQSDLKVKNFGIVSNLVNLLPSLKKNGQKHSIVFQNLKRG